MLHAARAKGENLVLVLGHAEYYSRFGLTPASEFGIRASFDVLDEAMMALALHPDAETSRGTIAYPRRSASELNAGPALSSKRKSPTTPVALASG
jgi:predicted N-acetyltransferase YhbS